MSAGQHTVRVNPYPKMKSARILPSLLVAASLFAGVAFAGDAKPANAESKEAKCCMKAAKDGKTCDHSCCTEAAAAGKNCEKCGGSGTMAKK